MLLRARVSSFGADSKQHNLCVAAVLARAVSPRLRTDIMLPRVCLGQEAANTTYCLGTATRQHELVRLCRHISVLRPDFETCYRARDFSGSRFLRLTYVP